jgi:hypothetical protein
MVRAGGLTTVLAVLLGSCDVDSLLEVSDPSRLLAEDVEVPAQANALVAGLEADFICGLGAYFLVTANLSDEYEDTNAGGDNWGLDRRYSGSSDTWTDNECTATLPSAYVPVSRARWVADNLVNLFTTWTDAEVDDRQERLARAYLLAGFNLYMLGAAHCSGALDEGPEITTAQFFTEAESRFTSALGIAQSQGLTDTENAALVGRARVRLFLGNTAGALGDAQEVDAGFVMNVFPSDTPNRLRNQIYDADQFTFTFGVPEWTRNLTTGGVADPRTATFDTGETAGGWAPTTVWAQTKYTGQSSPMPIARYEEAQLIIAEIQGGATAVGIINALRAPYPTLPVFASTDETEIQNEVILERQRELWFEGHRAYDVRRKSLPLFPAVGEPYQVGIKGGTYGDQTCIPMPIIESYNNATIREGN